MTAAVELFSPVKPSPSQNPEHFDVVVIGGGQAGLSVGYHLAQKGVRFLILDSHDRVGDSWRKRWDSLRLFTPARLDSLVGMPFPAAADYFPTRDEMADYLEAYAKRFELPVRTGTLVQSLSKRDGHFLIKTNRGVLQADQVVVAMASYQKPRVPELTFALDSEILQLHSSAYKNPEQLRDGPVLIAGAGNSGAEIGIELARRGHRVFMSGRDTGEVPFKMTSFWGRWLLGPLLLRVVFHRLLTIKTPMGRKARVKMLHGGGPLIRTRQSDLRAVGVERIPRVVGTKDGLPLLEDGSVIDVKNVVWCSGFHPGFSWIDLPVFDEQGEPKHVGGVATEPGLYFVGLHFLYSFSSTMIHGVGRDAARIVQTLVTRSALV